MQVPFSFLCFFPSGQLDAFDFEDVSVDKDKFTVLSLRDDAFDDPVTELYGQLPGFQLRGDHGIFVIIIGNVELIVPAFHGDVVHMVVMLVVDEHPYTPILQRPTCCQGE